VQSNVLGESPHPGMYIQKQFGKWLDFWFPSQSKNIQFRIWYRFRTGHSFECYI